MKAVTRGPRAASSRPHAPLDDAQPVLGRQELVAGAVAGLGAVLTGVQGFQGRHGRGPTREEAERAGIPVSALRMLVIGGKLREVPAGASTAYEVAA